MNIGKLRDRIKVQQKETTQNEFGEQEITYTTVQEIWAKVLTASSKEFYNKGEMNKLTYKVLVRSNSQITPEMIVKYKDKTLEISNILDADSKRDYMLLICEEVKW